ncbi:hypothetical protein TNCT_83141 [Trichonephila clavata]|uniref:Uncharacterized protein n=1 Tax=Trichonephila clavata TaxID=2740835 RepID=A0A8X6HZC7_TRICU|nr:hypothetical protein TNCT_83141 [Trichonephila clavata]
MEKTAFEGESVLYLKRKEELSCMFPKLRHSPLKLRHSPLKLRHSPLKLRHSPLKLRHSPLKLRYSPLTASSISRKPPLFSHQHPALHTNITVLRGNDHQGKVHNFKKVAVLLDFGSYVNYNSQTSL